MEHVYILKVNGHSILSVTNQNTSNLRFLYCCFKLLNFNIQRTEYFIYTEQMLKTFCFSNRTTFYKKKVVFGIVGYMEIKERQQRENKALKSNRRKAVNVTANQVFLCEEYP